jgi:hypothetical protein
MKKGIRFLGLGCLVLVLGMGGNLFYLYRHREFGPDDFHYPFVLKLKGKAPEKASQELASDILKQKFVYLGCGTQVTAYESEDHRYVVKFFNPRNTIKKKWFGKKTRLMRMNSPSWILKSYFGTQERLIKFFSRYAMAYDELRDEAGLIYVHLNGATVLQQELELVDKEGKLRRVRLEDAPFVLQKKVELVPAYLVKNDKKEAARQLYDLFLSRARKGYTDKLQTLDKNFGFADGRAVQLDVGRIRKEASLNPLQEMERIVNNITPSPPDELALALQECLEKSKQGTL